MFFIKFILTISLILQTKMIYDNTNDTNGFFSCFCVRFFWKLIDVLKNKFEIFYNHQKTKLWQFT